MGDVWRATDINLGRQVAIKVLPGTFAQDPAIRRAYQPSGDGAKFLIARPNEPVVPINVVLNWPAGMKN